MLAWRDIVDLDEKSAQFFPVEGKKIVSFLDFLQKTPEGQELLLDIQAKYGVGNKMPIMFNNRPADAEASSGYLPGGDVHFCLQDFTKILVVDQRTGKLTPVGAEHVIFHELSHAADPKLTASIKDTDVYRQTIRDSMDPSEVYAVNRTHSFIQKYFPHLPEWKDYNQMSFRTYVDSDKLIENAAKDTRIGSAQLIDICRKQRQFDYGHLSKESEVECQQLPNLRIKAKTTSLD